jgi:hypothetical protein
MARVKTDTKTGDGDVNQDNANKSGDQKFVDRAGVDVTHHLDQDPNDPRNAERAKQLPSLNDESQQ